MLNGVNGGQYTAETPLAVSAQTFKGYGLDWVTAFGKEHGKLVSIPEWGLDSTSTNAGGGVTTRTL